MIRPNTRGEICEGCISNLFFVKEGLIHTPSLKTGCLPGVMRGELVRNLEVREGEWPMELLEEVEEIWLSNALRRLRPLTTFNGREMAKSSDLFVGALASVSSY